ncbi:MAG: NAD-dependent epimerase/dehydratase family protein, partial [Deltaproteobacteria bacterium]
RPPLPPLSMAHVLLTGASGFLGQHLAAGLHDAGHTVRALVRSPERAAPVAPLLDDLVTGDLTRPETLPPALADIDAVVHAACAVQGTFDSASDAERAFQAVNVDGTRHLLDAIRRHTPPPPRLAPLSSTAAVGPPTATELDESTPSHPRTPYQRSKRAAEELVLDRIAHHRLDALLLRPCVIAGPGKPRSELLTLLRLVHRGLFPAIGPALLARKPLVHVDDVVQATRLALHADTAQLHPDRRTFFITSGEPHTLGDIVRAAGRVMGVSRTHLPIPLPAARAAASALEGLARLHPDWNPPLTHDRIDLLTADRFLRIDHARQHLGYRPTHTDPEAMLRDTAQWHRSRGELPPRRP